MKLSTQLLREKTNVGIKTNTTFNAPGNYTAPYGKTTVRVGGRGASGNANSGGNYAGESYAGETYAGTNPTTYPYGGTNPGTPVGTLYQYYNNAPVNESYNEYPGVTGPQLGSPYSEPTGHVVQYGTYYNTGNAYYNTVPGNAYYAPYYSSYYNPTVPGNTGANATIAGVYFPGGAIGSLAPVVPATTTTVSYSPSGLSITVPTGGYITIDNI